MKNKLIIFEIKHGKVEKLKRWYQKLDSIRRDEALESIRREGVKRKFATIVQLNEKYYDIGFSEVSNGAKVLPADQSMSVNLEHRAIMEDCLVTPPFKGELLYDLEYTP